MKSHSIIISNGFNKFHLAPAAAEMEERGLLAAFFTGAYPPEWMMRHSEKLEQSAKIGRLISRWEPIQRQHIFSDLPSESINAVGRLFSRKSALRQLGGYLTRLSMRCYGSRAARNLQTVECAGAKLFHYRAGFGHSSVRAAKKSGMIVLCDHSIAHPELLENLVKDRGKLSQSDKETLPMSPFWKDINKDINQAGHILVNSKFVKTTFLCQGWNPSNVHVIYLGIDDRFFHGISDQNTKHLNSSGMLNLLFAGAFEHRKGAEVLISALRLIDSLPWRFEIVGHISPEIIKSHKEFFQDPRVTVLGTLSRTDLAKCMSNADTFVFPSLAEGSARVIFEALACGCYVITTPNSGSIVEDKVHGRVVPTGDAKALADAIADAIFADRSELIDIGRGNAHLINDQYRQSHYGEKLVELYEQLLT